ncbi:MAG TPA: M48 family metalloprotease [Thermoanaerobaculia bacterium]|nr:M48 family metalloprotease [Thermoanaerobaculia bacterium]
MRAACRTLAAVLLLHSFPLDAQREVGVPFGEQGGYVLDFAPPYERLVLDLGENTLTSSVTAEIEIVPGAAVTGRKGAPVDRSALRPGIEVSVSGERLGSRLVAHRVRLLTEVEDRKVKVSGIFEKLQGSVATVGGQLVTLGPGARVSGSREWKGKSFASFDEMMLGSFVELEGTRGADGLTLASKGETSPNLYTDTEAEMLGQLRQGLVMPAANQLSGGQVEIGGQAFKLVRDLKIQTYVTRVGLKLIPSYLQDRPAGEPGEILFRFYVIDDPSFNAFAYPDGSVFVHTGLLAVIENEAQLAAVLGHEIAHVTHEHGRRQFEAGKKIDTGRKAINILGRVAEATGRRNPFGTREVAGVPVDVGAVLQFGTGVFSNVYSRDMENQADRVGLFYMYEAGYDPREAPKVWRTIVDQIGRRNKVEEAVSRVQTFLYSSHPEAKARLSNLNREVALNWYGADFGQTAVGKESYDKALRSGK